MPGFKSITAGGSDKAKSVAAAVYPHFAAAFPRKMYWFIKNGYRPHEWQAAFHVASKMGRLLRFRHLVAGRRGGKTLSAAWEVVYYCMFPEEFHMDAHGKDDDRALWVWVLAKDHEVGFAARQAILGILTSKELGLVAGKDYTYNKTEKKIEFANGTLLQFKSADDPQSLRGAGLDILWVDESAFVPNRDAWDVTRPSLSDKLGWLITTTTPDGKNWFHDEFWGDAALVDPNQFRVEYTSIDNPYFPPEEWEYAKANLHPVIFKREYMASFDAMSGIALQGEWLKYYTVGDDGKGTHRVPDKLRKFMAVDPAISLSDTADHFAMALVGLTEDNTQAYILKTFKDRIAFPDQLDKIREWFLEFRPELIGIESNAYQHALAQMANRMTGLPGIVPIMSKSKKTERILGLGPLFKIGKVRIHRTHNDFIDEWIGYNPEMKNPKDDLLDAVEIALGLAGTLLPTMDLRPIHDIDEEELVPPIGFDTVSDEATAAFRIGREVAYDNDLGANA